MALSGSKLLDLVAERIIIRWLCDTGRNDARATSGLQSFGPSVDLTYSQGGQHRVKIKADPYFGLDPRKVNDRSMSFYRADASAFAFEAVANTATRQAGWILESAADDVYYYFLAIAQAEEEVAALAEEPDDVLFSELALERDELVILPMAQTREWFESRSEDYTPRPVMSGGVSAWYRLVPRSDLERGVSGVRSVGPIFKTLSR